MKVSFKKIKKGEKFSKPSLFMGSDGKIRSNFIMAATVIIDLVCRAVSSFLNIRIK